MANRFDDDFFRAWLILDYFRRRGASRRRTRERERQIERARAKCEAAWARLYEFIYRFALLLLPRHRRDEAGAIATDVCLKLHRAFTSGGAQNVSFEAFVRTAARNAVVDLVRGARRREGPLVPLDRRGGADDARPRPLLDVLAHPAVNRERGLILGEERREQVRSIGLAWLTWVIQMRIVCPPTCPRLLGMLEQIERFLEEQIVAGAMSTSPKPSDTGEPSAEPLAPLDLLEGLNACLLAGAATADTVHTRRTRLKRLAVAKEIPLPPCFDVRASGISRRREPARMS